jgi:hypothetical protein
MSFYNQCCRAILADQPDAETANEVICTTCHNAFMYDGAKWVNKLELGQRKVDKLRTIGKVNRLAGPLFGLPNGKT